MNKNILKYFGLAALLALGVQTAEASDPAYYSYVSLYTASSSAGLGKVAANSGLINDLRNYMGEKRENVSSSYYSEEVGARTNWKSKNILIYIWAIPNDGSEFVGWYMDDACTKPLEEDEVAKVYEVAAHGAMTPAGAVESSVNLPTVTDASAATKIYAKFVKTASSAVAKIGGKEYETLAEAFSAAKDGDIVNLLAANYGENDLADIGKLGDKSVTVVGLGIDKTELKVVYGTSASDVNNLHFKDLTLTIDHSAKTSAQYTQTLCGTYEGVKFNGMIAVDHGTSTFTDCVFAGTTTGDEYLLWVYAGNAVVTGCAFEKSGTKAPIKIYGESGNKCCLSVANTTFGEVGSYGTAIYSSNNNNKAATSKVVYELVLDDATVTVPDGKLTVKPSGNGLSVVNPTKDGDGALTGGTFITANTSAETVEAIIGNVCAEGYAPKKNDDGTWGVEVAAKNFYQDETDKSLWHVANVAGLKEFRDSVNKGTSYANCTISIDADCDLTGEGYWTAIKAYVAPNLYLTGVTINGNGHTITGMRVANPAVEDGYNYGGGFIDKAGTSLTVKDLTFVNAEVQSVSGSQVAVVVGMSYGNVTLENVDIKNSTVTADTKAGAYVGQNDDGLVTFKDCDLINTVVKANYSAALFLGLANVSSDGWDFDANCSADENSKFEWVPGKWYKEKGDLSLYGRPYCLDEDVLVLTDSGEDCWAEKRTGEVRVIDGKDVTVWGSEFYPPYVESEPEVVPEKPTAEKVEEATKVVDESGEVVTPSAQQEAAAKTEVEKVAQSFDNPEIAKVETHVAEAAMTVTGEGEAQKVVVKSAIVEELQKAAPGDTAVQITPESDVKSYVKVALNEAKVAVKEEGAALKSVTFDVKPMAETTVTVGQEKTVVVAQIPNEEIEKPITFRLPLTDAFTVSAIVTHEGDPDRLCMVQGAPGGRYVEVTASHFSLFTATPSEIVETTTESKTVLGIKRVDYTVTQSTADLAAAVPWLMAAEENMPVSGLITTGISEGDQIQVYEKSANAYYTWLYRDGEWEGATGTPSADEYPLERGRAFWYKPVGGKGASGTYTQVGLYSESTITSKVDSAAVASASFANPVHFLMASPKYEDFNLKEKLTAAAGCVANDVVVIVATGKRYRFNESAWGQDLDQEVDIFGVKVSQKVFVPAEGEVIVPAGTAFWYLSAGGAPEFEW